MCLDIYKLNIYNRVYFVSAPGLAWQACLNLYGCVISQKLPVNDFKWVKQEELSKFNEDFIKNYDENGNIGYFF